MSRLEIFVTDIDLLSPHRSKYLVVRKAGCGGFGVRLWPFYFVLVVTKGRPRLPVGVTYAPSIRIGSL
jgi:hypothetical protein